jgi:hypothetical protein
MDPESGIYQLQAMLISDHSHSSHWLILPEYEARSGRRRLLHKRSEQTLMRAAFPEGENNDGTTVHRVSYNRTFTSRKIYRRCMSRRVDGTRLSLGVPT